MKKIQLGGYRKDTSVNGFALVDDSDFELLNKWKWHLNFQGYAVTRQARKFIRMHRFINNTKKGMDTDHINRNKLDNRRSNLRSATRSQNEFNKDRRSDNTSGHKGVSWDKKRKKWFAQMSLNNKHLFFGYFIDLKDAIYARKQAEKFYCL